MLNNKVIRFYLSCSALHYISLKRCNHSIIKMAIPLNTDVCSFDIFVLSNYSYADMFAYHGSYPS